MFLNENNLAEEIKYWFSKSIINSDINFTDKQLLKDALNIFFSDYKRYYPNDKAIVINNIINRCELQGILLYRLARGFFLNNDINAADKCSLLGRFLAGFEIYYSSEIGKGLKINHGLGLVIGARTKIGNNALLHQGVTFGDKDGGRPTIGNNVVVYAGAKILGNIKIGNDVKIAANCVCFIDVPDGLTVVGIPARIIKK